MQLKVQKRIAADLLKCSPYRIRFKAEALEKIKEAITKDDMRELISSGMVIKLPKKGVSRARSRKIRLQKIRGRRKGYGSRKGTKNARLTAKRLWMFKVRAQRRLLSDIKQKIKINTKLYRLTYSRIKGGYFRSRKHLLTFLKENKVDVKSFEARIKKKKRNILITKIAKSKHKVKSRRLKSKNKTHKTKVNKYSKQRERIVVSKNNKKALAITSDKQDKQKTNKTEVGDKDKKAIKQDKTTKNNLKKLI